MFLYSLAKLMIFFLCSKYFAINFVIITILFYGLHTLAELQQAWYEYAEREKQP